MSFVTNVRSANTPMTAAKSQASSKVRSTQWSFFKDKNNANYDIESRVSNSKVLEVRKEGLSVVQMQGEKNSTIQQQFLIPPCIFHSAPYRIQIRKENGDW